MWAASSPSWACGTGCRWWCWRTRRAWCGRAGRAESPAAADRRLFGGERLHRCLDWLAPFGRAVAFGDTSDAVPWQFGAAELGPGTRSVAFLSLTSMPATAPDALRALTERAFRPVADGEVELPATAQLPLAEAAEAHWLIGSRATTGKPLLRVHG
ncbi:zinc-binding dehydrogenase [Streptomyces sp. NPDC001820]|uniref:zinc-binding dehydrogenase n=1 Tax=Streptomyces sp. NPDC001820 TaxID=3364613 RepID=UPI0036CDDC3E